MILHSFGTLHLFFSQVRQTGEDVDTEVEEPEDCDWSNEAKALKKILKEYEQTPAVQPMVASINTV